MNVSLPELHRWQRECLDVLRPRVIKATGTGIVQASTGSGKSRVQGELSRLLLSTLPNDHINFVATSRRALVEQLYDDVARVTGQQFLGTFYGDGKRFLGKRTIFTTYKSLFKCYDTVLKNGGKLGSIILDEAHNTGAEAINDWLCELTEKNFHRLYGFTATDFRGNPKERLEWCNERFYSYGYAQAVADKVIVPFTLKTRAGEVIETDDEILQMIADTEALKYGAGLVTASDIDDAERFAKVMSDVGLVARHVASDQGRKIIPEIEEAFGSGRLMVITSPRLVSEGYDYPPLKWMCFRAPLSKEGGRVLAIQTVGRVLRRVLHPGKPCKYPREVARWGNMEEAIVLDPRCSFAKIGLDHEPALGFQEEEPVQPPTRNTEERTIGIVEARPDLLAEVHPSVAWAYALRAWTQQGPAVCPLAVCKSKPRAAPDRTPSAVTRAQWSYASQARIMLQRIANLNEPHRTLLFDGLDLVVQWSESDEGLGKWRAAAAICEVADTLLGWFGNSLFNHGKTLIIPDQVIPYTSSNSLDT